VAEVVQVIILVHNLVLLEELAVEVVVVCMMVKKEDLEK
jgi:hypothetical protein